MDTGGASNPGGQGQASNKSIFWLYHHSHVNYLVIFTSVILFDATRLAGGASRRRATTKEDDEEEDVDLVGEEVLEELEDIETSTSEDETSASEHETTSPAVQLPEVRGMGRCYAIPSTSSEAYYRIKTTHTRGFIIHAKIIIKGHHIIRLTLLPEVEGAKEELVVRLRVAAAAADRARTAISGANFPGPTSKAVNPKVAAQAQRQKKTTRSSS